MTTVPTEGQTEQNTGKVKQYITVDDIEEFKKKKRTKNATEITKEYKKKNKDTENSIEDTEGHRIDTGEDIEEIEDIRDRRVDIMDTEEHKKKVTWIMYQHDSNTSEGGD